MPNIVKEKIVDDLTLKFQNSSGIYFANYSGIDVPNVTKLRKSFRDNGVEFFVSKNTLTKIAAKNAGHEGTFDEILKGQIGIVYSSEDPIAPARIIKDFNKDNDDSFSIVGMYVDGVCYEPDKFKELSNLPTREELISKFASAINQPMSKFASVLNSVMTKFVGTLNSLKDNK